MIGFYADEKGGSADRSMKVGRTSQERSILMNAYLIAAKANAWEVDQHVGHAIVANQPEYEVDALGRGAGCNLRTREAQIMRRPHLLKSIFRAA